MQWAPRYQRGQFLADFVAGLTLATIIIPQSIAYALLAGLPAIIGLYSAVVPVAVYSIFGTSRHLSVGPFAVISLVRRSAIYFDFILIFYVTVVVVLETGC